MKPGQSGNRNRFKPLEFLLYQQENIPLIGDFAEMTSADVEIYNPTRPDGMNMASQSYITDLLQSMTFDTEKIKNLFADSSIAADDTMAGDNQRQGISGKGAGYGLSSFGETCFFC